MISFNNVSKSFGSRVLFDKVTFTLGTGERVGLVGRNGYGKSTFLNIIVGYETQDSGEIITPNNYHIGYLTQRIKFAQPTVREEGIASLPEGKKDFAYLAEKVLFGLGFTAADMDVSPYKLSGGYQVRLNLAKLLISEPNLLLLDEPTNYLDIASIRWLRSFLLGWEGEILFVTHDRAFMDSVATHIAGIHRQKIRKIAGDTFKYYDRIAQEEEIYEKTRINEETKRKNMELYITRFRAKARLAGLVQSRIKTLAKMEKKDRLVAERDLEFSFRYKDTPGETVIHAKSVTFGYTPDKPLIKELSFTLDKGDRVCIIGRNGEGKSTLMRIIAGKLQPWSGEVLSRSDTLIGYFEQTNIDSLQPEASIEDEVAAAGDFKLDRTAVRNICGAMLFSGEDALKKIKVLSGGEKCRVMLAKILASPCNCLLLDEPTNHLDMDAADSLLEAVDDFPGPVAIITHNEAFLHALATKLIVFQGGTPFLFEGGYAEFLEKIGWEDDIKPSNSLKKAANGKDSRKIKAELITERGRAIKPLQDRANELETCIMLAEDEMANINAKIEEATENQDGKELMTLGQKLSDAEARCDTYFEELNDVTVKIDAINAEYAAKLLEIE